MKVILLGLLLASGLCGCTVVSENRVFPKLDWYWSRDAKMQRQYDEWERRENAKEHATTPESVLPDRTLTPGLVDESITREMLMHPDFIRKRRNVPVSEKKEIFRLYGVPWSERSKYEIDHYIPLCLAGKNERGNLWLQKWKGPYGAHAKDRLELYLHRRVNKGQMTLQEAQACFLTEPWTNAYNRAGFKPGLKQKLFSVTHRAVQ